MAPDALRINPAGATLEVDGFFHTPLKLTLGQLHLVMIDRGPAKAKGQVGPHAEPPPQPLLALDLLLLEAVEEEQVVAGEVRAEVA